MKDIETPEELLNNFFTEQTECWKDFANEGLDALRKAREEMRKKYNLENEEEQEEMLRKFMIENIEKIDETIEMLDEKYPYLKNTLPVKCKTKPNTPFRDELAKYMMEYIEQIKNLRKNIKIIWNKDANKKQNNANEIAGK